jgi:hypothetical protein
MAATTITGQGFHESWARMNQVDFDQVFRIVRLEHLDIDSIPAEESETLAGKVDLAPLDYFKEAKNLAQVQAVMWKYEDEITYIWTAISPLDENAASALYDLEGKLYEKYPRARFNFYVFEAKNDPADRVPEGFDLLYERK